MKSSVRNWPTFAQDGDRALLAAGGRGGLGNLHFKSSTNRAPRQFTRGDSGEHRRLRLELRVLADVGLLGMPNAGKSTLIRAVSNARPKVADYPFTTLHPHLGVVRVGAERSFVIADVPGLIEGAAEGAGLGHQFLRHLSRTGLLLHVIDCAGVDGNAEPVADARVIATEVRKYSPQLGRKPRWYVLNKIDLVPGKIDHALVAEFRRRLRTTAPDLHGFGSHAGRMRRTDPGRAIACRHSPRARGHRRAERSAAPDAGVATRAARGHQSWQQPGHRRGPGPRCRGDRALGAADRLLSAARENKSSSSPAVPSQKA